MTLQLDFETYMLLRRCERKLTEAGVATDNEDPEALELGARLYQLLATAVVGGDK